MSDATDIIAARYTLDAYSAVARTLLPRGRVWTREDTGTQAATLDALAAMLERVDSAALTLIAAAFPSTATDLLPEWDSALGLPDACFGAFTTDDENRQQIVAKLIGAGGQSIAYFLQLAKSLGYAITIEEFSVHTVVRPVNVPIAGVDWAYGWQVTISGVPAPDWHTVTGPVGEALSSYNATPTMTMLACLLRRYAPAQTVLAFVFDSDDSDNGGDTDDGTMQWLAVDDPVDDALSDMAATR